MYSQVHFAGKSMLKFILHTAADIVGSYWWQQFEQSYESDAFQAALKWRHLQCHVIRSGEHAKGFEQQQQQYEYTFQLRCLVNWQLRM